MRCHEARKRLIGCQGVVSEPDSELRDHLRDCRECAEFAQAEQTLARDLNSVRTEQPSDDLPLSIMRTRVEAEAKRSDRHHERYPIMSRLLHNRRFKPGLGVTVALAVIVLALTVFVPFKVDNPLGYQVALAGVDPNLALDEGRMQELLDALGLKGVTYHVGDCDVTCFVTVDNLSSEGDVTLVLSAFDKMGNSVVREVAVFGNDSTRSVIDLKGTEGKDFVFYSKDAEESVSLTLDSLNKVFECKDGRTFNVWITEDDEVLTGEGKSALFFDVVKSGTDGAGGMTIDMNLDNGDVLQIKAVEDGWQVRRTTADGNTELKHFDSPEELEAHLSSLGVDFNFFKAENGSDRGMMFVESSPDGNLQFGEEDDALAKSGTLPDGFSLEQNYPNPFNPTTTIAYTLPSSQRVVLEIYNIQGQRVATLVDEVQGPGEHQVEWDATTDSGSQVASGVYLYRLTAGENTTSKKMVFTK